jgi:hypothetical protein
MKATVHCPRPPHTGWKRHYGIPFDAPGAVATAVKKDSGPHQTEWTGYTIGPGCTLEFRVIFRGMSLDEKGFTVRADTALLPIPTKRECIEVAVLLGSPIAPATDYPRYNGASTHLISEGRLSNGYRVWVVYYTTQTISERPSQQHSLVPDKFYIDPAADLSKGSQMRAAVYGVQANGHLAFWDMRAKCTPRIP